MFRQLAWLGAFLGSLLTLARFVLDGPVEVSFVTLGCTCAIAACAWLAHRPDGFVVSAHLLPLFLLAASTRSGWVEGGLSSIPALWLLLVPVTAIFLDRPASRWLLAALAVAALLVLWRRELSLVPAALHHRVDLRCLVMVMNACFGALLTSAYHAQRVKTERFLLHRATHDHLTGLPDRDEFFATLQDELRRAKESGAAVGVMMLDLDDFKNVNDRHGHLAGDAVLREVAARLRASVRQTETIFRFAGDEFVIVVRHADEVDLEVLGARVAHTLAQPIRLEGVELMVTVSVGYAVALAPDDSATLLDRADAHMYQRKSERQQALRAEAS